MEACAGYSIDNESNRKRKNPDVRLPSSCKRGWQFISMERILVNTMTLSNVDDSTVEKRQRLLNEMIEPNEAPSSTKLHDLPMEMLDIILQKSYLHWILNSAARQRDHEVIRSLTSVDVCFYQRIIRQRSKKAIWRYLKVLDFYAEKKKRTAILRNNRNYLLENIQPNDDLIASLLSLNSITEKQSHFIQRQRSKRNKNAELLRVMRSFDETKFSNFVKCFRRTNQRTVAKIIGNGGVVCPVSISFNQRIDIRENVNVCGVAKLRNDIYVLCQSPFDAPNVIRVFEDRIPFPFKNKIEIREIICPIDIGSSEKENCLYISDNREYCVWKITREANDQHTIIKWLTIKYQPLTLSVSSDDQLLVVNDSSFLLMIYGSDAELIRSIQLPRDIKVLIHAVETSIGNFIILHSWMEEEPVGDTRFRTTAMKYGICEVTSDGQMVIRRFIPSNEAQKLKNPEYLSLDSDDRVFVAEQGNGRVILLDCDLEWNRILCTTEEEKETRKIYWQKSLCYDEKKKQLIIGGNFCLREGVNVYNLSRN